MIKIMKMKFVCACGEEVTEPMSRQSLTDLGFILGQMTQSRILGRSTSAKARIVNEEVFEQWMELLEDILLDEVEK